MPNCIKHFSTVYSRYVPSIKTNLVQVYAKSYMVEFVGAHVGQNWLPNNGVSKSDQQIN